MRRSEDIDVMSKRPTSVHRGTQTVNELHHCRDIDMSEETCCVQFHLLLAEDNTKGQFKTVYYYPA